MAKAWQHALLCSRLGTRALRVFTAGTGTRGPREGSTLRSAVCELQIVTMALLLVILLLLLLLLLLLWIDGASLVCVWIALSTAKCACCAAAAPLLICVSVYYYAHDREGKWQEALTIPASFTSYYRVTSFIQR